MDDIVNDTISRQAAIDTLKNRWKKTRNYEGIGDDIAEECELYLKQVPPAQPSVSKEEMVGDTISRQAAINAICEDGTRLERQGKYTMTMAERKQRDVDILDTLPPAQHTAPETVEGRTTMTKEEAIKHLHTYSSTNGSGLTTQDQHEEAKKMAIKALETQLRWIPVTKRLPKSKEYVNGVRKHYLVQNEYGDMMVCSWDGCFWTQMYRTTHVKDKVAAWMPLPTPYREGGQE